MSPQHLAKTRLVLRRATLLSLLGTILVLIGHSEAQSATRFEGRRAARWVDRQCALGPRVPGSAAHGKCLELLVAALDSLRIPVTRHAFRVPSVTGPGEVVCTNLVASIRPGVRPRLLLGSHWDSRPWADEDPNPENRKKPVLGANDGASSTAVLLELARVLAANPPPIGVDLAFFDAEDLGAKDRPQDFCLGSQRLAAEWSGPLPDWVLVLDMVGAKYPTFQPELYSRDLHPEWVELVFETARQRGFAEFDAAGGNYVIDDHVPWLRRGVPATDLIGWGDPNWHTIRDTPAVISPTTLERVGTVVSDLIFGGQLGSR